jgi:hypothetical protein
MAVRVTELVDARPRDKKRNTTLKVEAVTTVNGGMYLVTFAHLN